MNFALLETCQAIDKLAPEALKDSEFVWYAPFEGHEAELMERGEAEQRVKMFPVLGNPTPIILAHAGTCEEYGKWLVGFGVRRINRDRTICLSDAMEKMKEILVSCACEDNEAQARAEAVRLVLEEAKDGG